MKENDKSIHKSNRIVDEVTRNIGDNVVEFLNLLTNEFFNYLKDKVKDVPKEIEKLLSNQEAKKEITVQWSNQLLEKGFISKGYNGLPDEFIVANLRQEGYLDGLYAGYVLALMSLVDNDADKDLILSVKDDLQSSLLGHHYDDRNEIYDRYKGKAYSWLESVPKKQNE